jgi:hypothetical protein
LNLAFSGDARVAGGGRELAAAGVALAELTGVETGALGRAGPLAYPPESNVLEATERTHAVGDLLTGLEFDGASHRVAGGSRLAIPSITGRVGSTVGIIGADRLAQQLPLRIGNAHQRTLAVDAQDTGAQLGHLTRVIAPGVEASARSSARTTRAGPG